MPARHNHHLNADVDDLIMERLSGDSRTSHRVNSKTDPEAVPMQVELLNTIQMSGCHSTP